MSNSNKCPKCGAFAMTAPNGDGCVDCICAEEVREASSYGRKITEGEKARLIEVMKSRGAEYPNDNFYGLVHETAHGFDMGLPNADPKEIGKALMLRGEWERLTAEVVAKSTSRWVSAYYGTELFPDGVRYAARSVKAFAERDGSKVCWTPDNFVTETVRLHKSPRVRSIILKVTDLLDAALNGA